VRGALTLAVAIAATAAIPAAAAAGTPKTSVFRVLQASGTQKVTFRADSSTCARFATCGSRGTVTYKFGGTARGRLEMTRDSRGHVTGAAEFTSHGTTTADVTAGAVCSDTVSHRREVFSIRSPSRLGKLIFGLHGADDDYLETDCAGPTEADLKRDKALPTGRFKREDFLARNTTFGLRGSHTFRERGYTGSTTWKLSYELRRRG
jgi:hypothetical protein